MKILVIAELDGERVRGTTWSAIAAARRVVDVLGFGAFSILVLGARARDRATELVAVGAERILVAEDGSLASYLAERYAPTIAEVASHGYDLVLATASSFGKDLLPRVAGRLDAAYAGDVLD